MPHPSDSDSSSSHSASKESSSTAASSVDHQHSPEHDPQAEFKGDVKVSKALPTKSEWARCVELPVLDVDGKEQMFGSLYGNEAGPSRHLIVFVRHFFCGNCQEYLRTLSASITPSLLSSVSVPTTITVIGCGQPDLIPLYVAATSCPYPIYCDPARSLYQTLGMIRTLDLGKSRPDYIQRSILGAAVQSVIQGLRSGRNALKSGDYWQVGGELLVECEGKGDPGRVTWVHRMRNTRDHAGIGELKKVLGLDGDGRVPRRKWSEGVRGVVRRGTSGSVGAAKGDEEKRSRSRSTGSKGVEAVKGAVERARSKSRDRKGMVKLGDGKEEYEGLLKEERAGEIGVAA
ncbi:hypothetical protein EV356DRAFT_451504 [Viridothelium virens]|uniref:AhpC-TSA-domain-containing protein n=1 Tax=Viridothelium virens TaxID=1048519 RepID=A0A6A6H1F6_VIRVR|nr:hypothetical protein EV356DRAFT_451504 [Viridothelium virens]